jgi:MT0933-like antitoxin protein
MPRPWSRPVTALRLPGGAVWGSLARRRWSTIDKEGFRDKADEALTQGEEEVDERTGGRFDEQTDQAGDAVRERAEGLLGGDQEGDEPPQ